MVGNDACSKGCGSGAEFCMQEVDGTFPRA
jgi:hypothetical protein